MNKELIYEIIMPDFPRVVRLSEHRRAWYYIKTKVLAGTHKLPADCLKEVDITTRLHMTPEENKELISKEYKATKRLPKRIKYFIVDPTKYAWKLHKKGKNKFEERLIDIRTKEFVVRNHLTAGTPNDEIINGQNFYNSKYDPYTAGKIMTTIHEYMYSFLKGLQPITEYPIIIDGFMYDYGRECTISGKTGRTWDVGNRSFPYNKAFEDVLQHKGIVKEDDFEHVVGSPRLIFVNLDRNQEFKKKLDLTNLHHFSDTDIDNPTRRLVYQIYKVCQ